MNESTSIHNNSFLSFKLGEEKFAANAGKVLSILELTKITEVPQAPSFMKGIINLRGNVLPIIDVRMKFGMTPTVYTPDTCIIVMDIEMEGSSVKVGILVDSVDSVLEIEPEKVLAAPNIGSRYRADFIEGVIQNGESFILLLDMDKIFSSLEIFALNQSATEKNISTLADVAG